MKSKEYSTKELLMRFIPYYKPYRKTLCVDLFCAALTTVCELVLPLIMRYITNQGIQDLAALSVGVIAKLGVLYLLLRVVDTCADYYMSNAGHVMGARIETDMRRDAYNHLQKLSSTYYSNTKIGQIMGCMTHDLFAVTEFAHHCPEETFVAAMQLVISFIILVKINLPLTVIIFLLIPVMLLCAMSLNKKMKKSFGSQRRQLGELNASIQDSLLGQKVVKVFTNEDVEIEKFAKGNARFLEIKKDTYRYMTGFYTTTRVFDGLMYLTVLVAGGLFMVNGKIEPGDMVAYMMYVVSWMAIIRRIIEFTEQFQRGMTGIERFFQLMDQKIDIFDEENAEELKDARGDIRFENVTFEYPDDNNQVFANLNLHIKPGEKVAIVGPSGGGKTTLCNLIPRLYDVTAGQITLDGRNIKSYTLKSLRSAIGMVQQEVYLFSGTVYENILYGRTDATREEVMEAAKRAGAHEFIMGLKDGYDSYIGERGVKLSGGQKQRISIARVFLKNPPIMIWDEATSALDNESEYEVAKSLEELAEGRTTLTVAHRLSTIRNSDRILVLTEEGFVEEGTHDELMAKKGLYCQFYERANEMK